MHHPLLRYIDEVARQGSIRKAAKVMNVASSAVNRQILKAEAEFDTRLFDRLPEGVELTAAGRVVVEHCRRTLYDYRNLRAAIDDIRDLRSGHIHISTLDSTTFGFLPQVMEDFSNEYPGISFTVATAGPDETIEAVAKGLVHVGLSFTRDLHPDVRVVAEKPSPFGVIMRPDHPLADRHYVTVEDCVGFPLVRTMDARGKTSIIDQEIDTAVLPLSTIFYTNAHIMAKHAIKAARGIGIYTKIGFLSDIKSGELRFVPLAERILSEYKIGAIVSAHKNIETSAHLFVNAIERHFRKVDFT